MTLKPHADLKTALDMARMIAWNSELHSEALIWSGDYIEFFGLPPTAHEGTAHQAVHPTDIGHVATEATRCKRTGDEFFVEWRDWTGERWYASRGRITPGTPGQSGRMVGVTWEVTGRVRAEEALGRREALYRALVENGFDAITLLDADSHVLYNGPRNAAIMGRGPDDQPDVWGELHPDDAPAARIAWQKILTTPDVTLLHQTRRRHKDGRWIWIEATSTNLLHDPHIQAIVVIWRDITAQKITEEKARDAQMLLEKAQEVGRIGCWWSDVADDGALFWTKEISRITGLSDATFDGKVATFFRIIHPDDVDTVKRASHAAFYKGKPFDIEYRIVRPNSEVIWVLARAEVFFDMAGRPVQMVGILQDITERKRFEQSLLQAQKLESVGRLAGGVAHDFNNLLTIILGHAHALEKLLPSDATQRRHLEAVQTAAQRGSDLVKRLLAFGRKRPLVPQAVVLTELVAEAMQLLHPTLDARIELYCEAASPDVVVRGDPTQLLQILMNLALNARDAMPRGGRLTFTVDVAALTADDKRPDPEMRPGGYGVLRVVDTGFGLSDEAKAHLFEPFFTTKGVGQGTGLGLASCYGIVKQHGGGIRMHSQPGAGTTVDVFLPLSERADDQPEVPHEPANGRRGDETVLVVEDEPRLRELIVDALQEQGYCTLAAADGETALAAAAAHDGPIHLLITDVAMPSLGGPNLAVRLRLIRPELQVLYVSGYTADVAMRDADASAFLEKPFTMTNLLRITRELLDGRC